MENFYVTSSIQAVAFHSVAGVLLGLITNKVNKTWLDSQRIPDPALRATIKIAWLGMLLLWIQSSQPGLANDWQSTTPGLFFVSFFFGLQNDIMSDLNSVGAKWNF